MTATDLQPAARLTVLKGLLRGKGFRLVAADAGTDLATVHAVAVELGHPDAEVLARRCRSEIRDLESQVARASTSPFGTTRFPGPRTFGAKARPEPYRTLTQEVEETERELGLTDPVEAVLEQARRRDIREAAAARHAAGQAQETGDTTTPEPGGTTVREPGPDLNLAPFDAVLTRADQAGTSRAVRVAMARVVAGLAARVDPSEYLQHLDEEVYAGRPVDPDVRRLMAAIRPAAAWHGKQAHEAGPPE